MGLRPLVYSGLNEGLLNSSVDHYNLLLEEIMALEVVESLFFKLLEQFISKLNAKYAPENEEIRITNRWPWILLQNNRQKFNINYKATRNGNRSSEVIVDICLATKKAEIKRVYLPEWIEECALPEIKKILSTMGLKIED